MQNNYEFWKEYLNKINTQILKLCKTKDEIYIDMHIHSNYSADGKQSIIRILDTTKSKGFDIIAITDHDTLDAYDELYNYIKNDITLPIIVPGIEFTMDNSDYGNQCHILQLFINPKDSNTIEKVKKNYEATYNRSKLQFKRLKQNKAVQEILKTKKMKVSYTEYLKFIKKEQLVPEYDTLAKYLMKNFKNNNITNFDILDRLEFYNTLDIYENRKNYKLNRFKKLRQRYPEKEENYYNERFLMSMLAIKEVDDDWWGKPSSGSLSVNSYGQLKIEELNKNNITFAHPTETKLKVVKNIINENNYIIGLERNIRNEYVDDDNFMQLIKAKKLYMIPGSDSHDDSLVFYDNMNFFKIDSKYFVKLMEEIINGKN